VVAVKDDLRGDFARQLAVRLPRPDVPPYVVSSRRHPTLLDALQRNDLAAAAAVAEQMEWPLERYLNKLRGGRDAGLHALLEIYGIAGRWRRPPYYSLNDTEVDELQVLWRA
jgi:hypothetical protein